MALATIQDVLSGWKGWATLSLSSGVETSGQGTGVTRVKDLRPRLWMLDAQSVELQPSVLKFWRARLDSLDDGIGLFYGYDLANFYPTNYPKGAWPTGGSFDGVSAKTNSLPTGSKSMTLKSLPVGYIGAVGDMISFPYGSDGNIALHEVMEAFTANGSGVTGAFEVRPTIITGAAINDTVSVKRPACKMMMVPGSLSMPPASSKSGAISFKGIQVP